MPILTFSLGAADSRGTMNIYPDTTELSVMNKTSARRRRDFTSGRLANELKRQRRNQRRQRARRPLPTI
jgi:hypothetical protein